MACSQGWGLGLLGGFPLVTWPKGPKACLCSVAPPPEVSRGTGPGVEEWSLLTAAASPSKAPAHLQFKVSGEMGRNSCLHPRWVRLGHQR